MNGRHVGEVEAVPFDGGTPDDLSLFNLVERIDRLSLTVEPACAMGAFEQTPKDADHINLTLTAEGKKWCKANLVPIWDELGLPLVNKQRQIASLSSEQCVILYERLGEVYGVEEEDEGGGF